MLAILAVAFGIALGLAMGGSVGAFRNARIRFEIPIVLLFLAQGVARGRILGVVMPAAMAVWIAASVALVLLLALNRGVEGLLVAASGVLLNLVATLANLGMPVAMQDASAAESLRLAQLTRASGGLYAVMGASTIWPWAGDVIPLSFAGQTLLLSVGDVLLLVGVLVAVVAIMLTPNETGRFRVGGLEQP